MNNDRIVFDIVRPAMAEAQTVGSIFSSPEEDNIIYVKANDGNTYEVVAWGADNQLPYQLKEKVEKNSVMSQDKFFNVLTCYGRGLEYMDVATQNEKKPLPTSDTEIKRFFIRNNMKRFFAEQVTDLKYYFFCVCVVILNRERTRIVRLVHKDACHVRFQKADENGRIKNILFADWKDSDQPENVEVLPLLDEYDPLGDLMARADKERDPLGIFKVMPRQYTKFAIVCRMPTVGCHYYPIPYWSATLRDGWYDIYGLLTAAKKSKIKNGQNIRYHVEINTEFWENRARERGISLNTQAFVDMKDDFVQQLKEYLGGSENSDKLIWSEFNALMDGKERHNIKINVVDTSKAGNEYNDDVAEASNVLAYSDNVHPNLAGATPGKSQMNNSGSDKRELFTMKQALETMPHDMMMTVHQTVIHFNGWEEKVYPDVPMIMLTTLDKNTDGKQTTTNNGENNGNTEGNN
ncbi:MAG: hypothetical protein IJ539_05855 [Prevotella sp.]|nr:hypothetical protein [Prevotella sp.]MBR1651852.1 hypothetical protein [Alloprevotella sp.]